MCRRRSDKPGSSLQLTSCRPGQLVRSGDSPMQPYLEHERSGRVLSPARKSLTAGRLFRASGLSPALISPSLAAGYGFALMLAVLRSRPGLKVAAWHADRLTRNPGDTGELIRVGAAGGHLAETPAGGSCDLSAATGRTRRRTMRTTPRARSVTVVSGCWQRGRRLPQAVAGSAVRGRSGGSRARTPWTPAGSRCLTMTATRSGESCRCGRTRRTRLPRPAVTYPAAPRPAASRGTGTAGASSPLPGRCGADAKPGGCSVGPGTRVSWSTGGGSPGPRGGRRSWMRPPGGRRSRNWAIPAARPPRDPRGGHLLTWLARGGVCGAPCGLYEQEQGCRERT